MNDSHSVTEPAEKPEITTNIGLKETKVRKDIDLLLKSSKYFSITSFNFGIKNFIYTHFLYNFYMIEASSSDIKNSQVSIANMIKIEEDKNPNESMSRYSNPVKTPDTLNYAPNGTQLNNLI